MKATPIEPIAPGNPYLSDHFRMGKPLGTNCTVMFDKHDNEHQNYIIVVDMTTGERLRIDFDEKKE